MSTYLSIQAMADKLANVKAEKDAVVLQMPKLNNLTRIIVQQNEDVKRYREIVRMAEMQILRLQSRLNLLLKLLERERERNGEPRDKKSIAVENLSQKCERNYPIFKQYQTERPDTSLEHLVQQLNRTKQALKEALGGGDIDKFVESSDYKCIISKLQDVIAAKNHEIEDLRSKLTVGNDSESIAVKVDEAAKQIKTLERALHVKHTLVETMNEHIEKVRKEHREMEERYASEIAALKEDRRKQVEKEQKQQSDQTVEALKLQLRAAAHENKQTEYKLEEHQRVYNKLAEELEVRKEQNAALVAEKEALKKRCQLLEERTTICNRCEQMILENQELLKEKQALEERMVAVVTQMQFNEEDYKQEKKEKEAMKSKYDKEIARLVKLEKSLSSEINRLHGVIEDQKRQIDSHQQKSSPVHQQYSLRTSDYSRYGGYTPYTYEQPESQMARPWQAPHSALPSDVMVDGPDVDDSDEVQFQASMGSHISRVCPRCEREFGPSEKDYFEKHVEKCLYNS